MVKIRYITIILSAVIIGILLAIYFYESEEKKIKKRFNLLSELVSKESGEKNLKMLYKSKNICTLFTQSCIIKTHVKSISGTFTRQEVSNLAVRFRPQFAKLSLRFYDLDITFPEKRISIVNLTVRLTGKLERGDVVEDTLEVNCILNRIEKTWLFSSFEAVEVLKK